jgi:hypothetical protein
VDHNSRKTFWTLPVAAVATALLLTACGGGSNKQASIDPPPPVENPAEERSAIQTALNAATAAFATVGTAGVEVTGEQLAAAEAAVAKVKATIKDADDLSEEEIGQFEAALALIDNPLATARTAYDGRMETAALAAARKAAGVAAEAARTAANQAQDAAARIAELAGSGSAQAKSAQSDAEAAKAAADAAEAAADSADTAETSAAAQNHQATAETEKGKAEGKLADAKELKNDVELAHNVGQQQQEQRDIAAAQNAAKMAAQSAESHYEAAKSKALQARQKATDARAAANRAMAARTDYAAADNAADAAEAAATAAEAARDAAMKAKDAANVAYEQATNAETSAVATTAKTDAEAQLAIAKAKDTGAAAQYDIAMEKATEANNAAGMHVIELFRMANAYHITTAPDPLANTDETEAGLIAQNKAAHVRAVDATISAVASTARAPYSPYITAAWPSGSNLGLTASLSVAAGGNATIGTGSTGTTTVDGLRDFNHGFGFSRDNAGTNTRILVFTDKEEGTAAIPSESVSLTNEPVSDVTRITPTTVPITTAGSTLHDFNGTYDHDGNPGTSPITGTFHCMDPTTCSVTRTGSGPGNVTAISGYRFTGTGTTPAVPAREDTSYLAFGVWLEETVVAGGTNTYRFGSFADGGSPLTSVVPANVTGTATYNGSAAGVRSTPSRVDFFNADATLTADFGANEITGRIHNIVAGGEPMSDDIHLDLADIDVMGTRTNIDRAAGSFGGRTRMGEGTLGPDGEQDYLYNGFWDGRFYNPASAGGPDAPGSVAGTFGVSRPDNAATANVNEAESYDGAFGAHRQ